MSNSNNGRDREAVVAKTAGLIVFSGIAISILKTLYPFKKNNNTLSPPTSSFNAIPQPPSPCLQAQVQQQLIVVVSIDAIKEADGLTGNTISAGKKLIIP